jgi:hypothetical protein
VLDPRHAAAGVLSSGSQQVDSVVPITVEMPSPFDPHRNKAINGIRLGLPNLFKFTP